MKMILTLIIVLTATILLTNGAIVTDQFSFHLHDSEFINRLFSYQILAVTIGTVTTLLILIIDPKSKKYLSIGGLSTLAEKERWLGISGKTSWKKNGLQLVFFISIPTAIFMYLGLQYANTSIYLPLSIIPYVVLFSLTNSFAEELIFRFSIVGGLHQAYPKSAILIASALIFGVPHYFGSPGGIIGVLMSTVLGYILCKVTFETKGLLIAWVIHFIQDIIIFTAIFMMNMNS